MYILFLLLVGGGGMKENEIATTKLWGLSFSLESHLLSTAFMHDVGV